MPWAATNSSIARKSSGLPSVVPMIDTWPKYSAGTDGIAVGPALAPKTAIRQARSPDPRRSPPTGLTGGYGRCVP